MGEHYTFVCPVWHIQLDRQFQTVITHRSGRLYLFKHSFLLRFWDKFITIFERGDDVNGLDDPDEHVPVRDGEQADRSRSAKSRNC